MHEHHTDPNDIRKSQKASTRSRLQKRWIFFGVLALVFVAAYCIVNRDRLASFFSSAEGIGNVLSPLFIGCIIAYLLNPILKFYEYFVFRKLKRKDGPVNASKIAYMLTITRSVIVNALRKLESAGVVEPKSQGMKGTHIKVLNEYLWNGVEELAQETEMHIDDIFAEYGRKLVKQYVEQHAEEHGVADNPAAIKERINQICAGIEGLDIDVVDITDIDFDRGFKVYAEEQQQSVADVNPAEMLTWYIRKYMKK